MIDKTRLSRRNFLELGGAASVTMGLAQAGLVSPAQAAGAMAPVAEEDAVIAFGWVGPIVDEGWTTVNDRGRLAIEAAFPKAKTIMVENIPYSADAKRTFRQFVADGANIVFTNSSYGDYMYDVCDRSPQTAFLHCDDRLLRSNMGSFYPSHWYTSYVTGVAAGHMTKSGKLGYVGSFPVPTVYAASNAFLMGARTVRPDATIQVITIQSWFDPQGATQAARALTDNGVDVLYGVMNEPSYLQVAQERGVKAVMLATDSRKHGPDAYISSIAYNFDKFYVDQVQKRLDGTWTPELHLLPFGEATYPDAWGETVTPEARAAADAVAAKIKGGWNPFSGEIRDSTGAVRLAADQTMSDKELFHWNWSIEGSSGL